MCVILKTYLGAIKFHPVTRGKEVMARPKSNPAIFTLCFSDHRGEHTVTFKQEKQVVALMPAIEGGKWTYSPDGKTNFTCHFDEGGELYYKPIRVVAAPKTEAPPAVVQAS